MYETMSRNAILRQGSPVDELEAFVNSELTLAGKVKPTRELDNDQLDRAALQLFLLDNPAARWPQVNQHHYRQEAKSILDAALSRS